MRGEPSLQSFLRFGKRTVNVAISGCIINILGGILVVTFTVDKYGRPGMPTFNIKKIRKLLKSGKAQIICHHPFTVKLLYAEKLDTQPVEICLDTGDKHIGVSVKSEKHEFVHAQYDPLPDEKERHDDRRRYRRTRRNRLRYRKPRFDNSFLYNSNHRG